MADSNFTLRMADELRARLDVASKQTFQTLSDFVIQSVTNRLNGACPACGRDAGGVMVQSPGMGEAFETWLRAQAKDYGSSHPVSIATQEPSGPRVYTGRFSAEGIHDSYVSLRPEEPGHTLRNPPDFIPIPRAYVVMWESNAAAEALRARLRNWGYQDVTAMLLTPPAPQPQRNMPRSVAVSRGRDR